MGGAVNFTNKKSNSFLCRYFAQDGIEGFSLVTLTEETKQNIELMLLLLTIGSGRSVNGKLHCVQSYCDDNFLFFLPELAYDFFNDSSGFVEQINFGVNHWKIEPFIISEKIISIQVEMLFVEVRSSGFSFSGFPYPQNTFPNGGRIITAMIPFKEIGL